MEGLTLEDLARARRHHLEALRKIEEGMVPLLREELAAGESLRSVARRAGLVHPTVVRWLSR